MGWVMQRAGRRLLDNQLVALREQLEVLVSQPYWHDKIVVDVPGADLDAAAAAALDHLDQARQLLAPFFIQDYVVGDVVDVIEVSETTGAERIEIAGATVVEIHGEGFRTKTVVEDADGDRQVVEGSAVRKREREP